MLEYLEYLEIKYKLFASIKGSFHRTFIIFLEFECWLQLLELWKVSFFLNIQDDC